MPDDNWHLLARNETVGTHDCKLCDGVKPRVVGYECFRGNVQLMGIALVEAGDEHQLCAGVLGSASLALLPGTAWVSNNRSGNPAKEVKALRS